MRRGRHRARTLENFPPSQVFSHADVLNDGEYRFARSDNDESMPDIKIPHSHGR